MRTELRHGADGLRNRCRLADAAGLDDDIVELPGRQQVGQLGDQVHLQGTADTAVLQGDQAVILLADDAAFLDQVRVDVDFAYVIDEDGETDAFAVGKDPVQKGGLSAAEIAGQQQDRDLHIVHHDGWHIPLSLKKPANVPKMRTESKEFADRDLGIQEVLLSLRSTHEMGVLTYYFLKQINNGC